MQVVDFANATMEFINVAALAPQEAMTLAEQEKQALRAEVERKDAALREWRREERAELDTAKRAVKDANRRAHDLRCATDQHKRDLVAAKAELAETKKAVQTDIRDNLARQAEAHAREMAEYRARQEEYVNGVVSECDRTKGRNALLVCRNQALEAEARDSLLREIADPGTFVDMHAAIDALERACIDEAVAPALEFVEFVKDEIGKDAADVLRKLLTERAGT
jgi:chromosome segregation ATPase